MPERRYIALTPPKTRDRLLAHWAEVAFILIGLKQGILVALEPLRSGPGPGVVDLGPWQAAPLAVFLILGSALWLFTVVFRFRSLADFLKWQRIGLGFTGLGWLAFTGAAMFYRPEATSAWTTGLLSAIAAWGLFVLSWVYEARIHTITPGPAEGPPVREF